MNTKFTKKSPFSSSKKQPKKADRLDKSGITKLIKSTIERRIEKKIFTDYATNFAIVTAASSTPTYRTLLPLISQGAAKSQRIGNEIQVKKAVLNVAVNILPSGAVNSTPLPCYVKIWIVKFKELNGVNLNSTTAASNWFETNNSSVALQGSMLDVLLKLDTDLWEVVAERMVRLGTTSYFSGGLTTFPGYLDNSPMSKTFSIDVTKGFPKTVKYNDNGSTTPTNCNLYVVWQAVAASGVSSSGQSMAEYHIGYHVDYIDL